MKRLTTLLMAVCIFAVIGCQNKITNNITQKEKQSMLTIEEAGGTPLFSVQAVSEFLGTPEFGGVFATEAGSVGYKIKDSKIYYVEKQTDEKQIWTEIPDDIAVDRNLNKLQFRNPESGRLEVLTFDGFGYRSYIQGEAVRYYQRYDYLDKFAGKWNFPNDSDYKDVEITADGCITLNWKKGSFGPYTAQTILEGNILTFKGGTRDSITFDLNADGTPSGKAVYVYASGGASYQLNKQ